nr:hypothetical protein [Chloroflexota bacterium]
NAVKEFFSNFKTIGAGIVEGIKQGIEDAKDGLKDFIMDFLRRIVPGWAHTALGIESPSKVFAEIGYSMADGLGVGLVEGMAEVIPAMEQVMGHIMAADAQMGGSLAMPDVHVPAIASGVSPPLSDVTVGGWIATIGNGGAQAGDLFAQRFAKSAIESPGMRTFAENMVAMLMDELTNYVDGGRVL